MTENFKDFANNNKQFINDSIKTFMGIYYYSGVWQQTFWRGYRAFKYPTDMWTIQEIISETKPDIIIETGVMYGGSTLFLADMLELFGNGKVIAVENNMRQGIPTHNRIVYVEGDSTSNKIVEEVKKNFNGVHRVMVVLDSAHYKKHVLKEMEIYSKFVTPGCYMIVDDTCISGHPVRSFESEYVEIAPGPYEAVMEFLSTNKDFEIDFMREKFFVTTNPRGFLRRKAEDQVRQAAL